MIVYKCDYCGGVGGIPVSISISVVDLHSCKQEAATSVLHVCRECLSNADGNLMDEFDIPRTHRILEACASHLKPLAKGGAK